MVVYLVNTLIKIFHGICWKKSKIVKNLAKIWTKMCSLLFWPPCRWKDVHPITKMYVIFDCWLVVLSVLVLFVFKKLNNSVSVQMSNNPVCKLRNNYFRFVGRHLGFPTSGCIWQHSHLLKTNVLITKLLWFDIMCCLNHADSEDSGS